MRVINVQLDNGTRGHGKPSEMEHLEAGRTFAQKGGTDLLRNVSQTRRNPKERILFEDLYRARRT